MNASRRILIVAVCTLASIGGCPEMPPDTSDPNTGQGSLNALMNDVADLMTSLADLQDQLDATDSALQDAQKALAAQVYGDGSAGSRTISQDLRLGDQGDTNLQCVDFTIEAGVTLTVQSGTVIRCTGTFINLGRIVVQTGTEGGDLANDVSRPAPWGIITQAAGELTNDGFINADGDDGAGGSGGGGADGNNTPEAAGDGSIGFKLQSTVDPTALL